MPFNGYQMVRTGHYNGVPVYADATRDPYSVVYVPIGSGQLKPYERRRRGELAGSTGSTLPSFPVALTPDQAVPATAAGAPTNLPYSAGAVSAFTPEVAPPVVFVPAVATAAPTCSCEQAVAAAVAATAVVPPLPTDRVAVLSVRRPDNNDGVWIRFEGTTWVSTGVAEPLTSAFTQVGELGGFPVYRKPDGGAVTRAGSSGIGRPRPASASAPTSRRTIFHRKCEPSIAISTSAPRSAIVQRSTSTRVERASSPSSSGSCAANDRKSPMPTNASAARCIFATTIGSLIHHT